MKARKIAEIGLALIGIHTMLGATKVISSAVVSILQFARMDSSSESAFDSLFALLPSILLSAALPVLIGFLLIRMRKSIAALLTPIDESVEQKDAPGPEWETGAYSVVFVLAGVLIVGLALPRAGMFLVVLFHNLARAEPGWGQADHRLLMRESQWGNLGAFIVQFAFGLCLLLRAPRLARWCATRAAGKAAT